MNLFIRLFESKEDRIRRERLERLAGEKERRVQSDRAELLRRADRLESRVGVSVWHDNLKD